jgi:deoxyribonuclease V
MDVTDIKRKFSIQKAHKTQLKLSEQIIFDDRFPRKIRYVAGVDVAYSKGLSIGAAAVLDYDSLKLVESQTASCKTRFPYIPTLLSFREIPPAVLCIKKLRVQPDVCLVDAQGFAHTIVINKPTVGVAKSKLFGEVEEYNSEKDVAFLKHKGKVVGATVITKHGCKPVYVSVGHMVSLETGIKIVKHCVRNNRIPEPTLEAHKIAAIEKTKNQ